MAGKRGNGEGSIVKRKDGSWMGAVVVGRTPKGDLNRKYFYGKTRKEVADKMLPILSTLQAGEYVEPSKVSLSEWLDIWLNEYKKNALKPTTFDSYETNIRYHLKPAIGHISLKDLKTYDLQKFINEKYDNGKVSTALLRKLRNILHGALQQAIVIQHITKNVTEGLILPQHKQKDIKVLTREEEKRFKEALAGDKLETAFKFALASGLRIGEFLGLTWDCIDWEQGIISVRKSLIRVKDRSVNAKKKNKYIVEDTTKTKNSKRKVPIPKSAMVMMEMYKQNQETEKGLAEGVYDDNNLVFCTALGNRIVPRNAERSFTRLAKKAGIEGASIHSLRHTYATRLFELGVASKTVSELLGHKNVSHTLDVYTHVLPDTKNEAVQKLDSLFIQDMIPTTTYTTTPILLDDNK